MRLTYIDVSDIDPGSDIDRGDINISHVTLCKKGEDSGPADFRTEV